MTLLEIMVASALLTVIMLGLMAMFGQTQRAYQGSMRQVDVLEGGRAAIEAIAREFEQITISAGLNQGESEAMNFFGHPFWESFSPQHAPLRLFGGTSQEEPLFLQDIFFLARQNGVSGSGFIIDAHSPRRADGLLVTNGVGTLYFFRYPESHVGVEHFIDTFQTNRLDRPLSLNTNFHQLLSGVVHFRVYAYSNVPGPGGRITNGVFMAGVTNLGSLLVSTDHKHLQFQGERLPDYLELELGVMEPQLIERARGIENLFAQRAFLSNRTDRIHIFRQTIPIRSSTQQ